MISLDASTWKLIACISMLADHLAVAIFLTQPILFYNIKGHEFAPTDSSYYWVYFTMRAIGRLAFPIFSYFIVEGYYKTKSLYKYIGRMAIFAIISEIPFNLVAGRAPFYPQYQNVLVTYLLALAMLCTLDTIDPSRRVRWHNCSLYTIVPPYPTPWLKLAIIGSFAGIGYLVKSDYGVEGILLIALIHEYYFKIRLPWYSGNYGVKWINRMMYWFYPVHLGVIGRLIRS